jgi:glucokinase
MPSGMVFYREASTIRDMAENNGKSDHFIGVDLGGTKILTGVFNGSFQLRGTAKLSTKAQRGPQAVIMRIARCVRDAIDEADLDLKRIRGIGIGAPGTVDAEKGEVIFAPNLDWHEVALKEQLQEQIGLPVFVENDCNASALAVHVIELKGRPAHMLGIFVGTGIGGGLVINGRLYGGFGHAAGEVGHMIIDVNGPRCACGQKGCLEALASRTAMFERIKAAIKDGQKTVLTDLLGCDLKDMRSGDLRRAVRRGDKLVEAVVKEASQFLGIAVANLANILNPQVIVLGGGVIEALPDEMHPIIAKTAKDCAMPGALNGVEILLSALGDKAAITGGAVLARQMTEV